MVSVHEASYFIFRGEKKALISVSTLLNTYIRHPYGESTDWDSYEDRHLTDGWERMDRNKKRSIVGHPGNQNQKWAIIIYPDNNKSS